ncbi:restriction endonuclease subunit S [Streptomyces griseoaurantiacus]|uniref:restriction endonuclease subunit S n=1 Tax=Streptomyces griseoaurantiacus TaxID=68213 RepID=UPI0032545149
MWDSAEIQWTEVRNVGDVRMGKQLSPTARDAPGQFPYLRVANVHLGRIDYADVNTMGFTSAEREAYGLKPGDILLNEGQSLELVGRSAIYDGVEGRFCFQNTLIRFRPGADVLPAYAQVVFERWLATGVFAAIAKKTTSIAHLGGDRFGALLFPLIPVAAQRRIVEVIESSTALERGIEATIAKLRSVRHGVLVELASPSLAGQSAEGHGTSAESFSSLGNVLERIEVGVASAGPEATPAPGEWGVIRLGAVTSGRFDSTQVKRLPTSVKPRRQLEIVSGDLLMVRVNGSASLVGSAVVVDKPSPRLLLSDLIMRLVPKSGVIDFNFLGAVLSAPFVRRQVVARFRGTSGQFQIPQSELESVTIPLPDLPKQREAVATLKAFDEQVSRESGELSKLRHLRQGLVDELLSGRLTAPVGGRILR